MDLALNLEQKLTLTISKTKMKSERDEEAELTDLRWIRDLILKFGEAATDLKIGLDRWLEDFENSETDFKQGSQLPSLNIISYAVLVDHQVLGKFYQFLMKKGEWEEGRKLCDKIVNGFFRLFGFDHHKGILQNFEISLDITDFSVASSVSEEFGSTLMSNYDGPDSKLTLTFLFKLAKIYLRKNRAREALLCLQAVHHSRQHFLGPFNLETIKVETQMALCHHLINVHGGAEEILRRAVYPKLKIHFGRNNEEALQVQFYLGVILCDKKMFTEALNVLKNASVERAVVHGRDHDGVYKADQLVGFCYMKLKEYKKARDIFKSIHTVQKELFGPQHSRTLDAHSRIGQMLVLDSKFREALKEFKSLYTLQKSALGHDHGDTLTTVSEIVHCFKALDNLEEALDWRKLILDHLKKNSDPRLEVELRTQYEIVLLIAQKGKHVKTLETLHDIWERSQSFLGDDDILTVHLKEMMGAAGQQWAALQNGEKLICSICLGGMEFMEEDVNVPFQCSHIFHGMCVLPWLRNGNTCPQCRSPISAITLTWMCDTNVFNLI